MPDQLLPRSRATDEREATHAALWIAFLAIGSVGFGYAATWTVFRILSGPQRYDQLVVGPLAISGTAKTGELPSVLAGILVGAIAWAGLQSARRFYERAGLEPVALAAFQLSLLPVALWIGKMLLAPTTEAPGWLLLGCGLVVYWMFVAWLLPAGLGAGQRLPETAAPALALWVVPVLMGYSVLGFAMATSRFLPLTYPWPWWPSGFLLGGMVVVARILRSRRSPKTLLPPAAPWLSASQLGIPLLAYVVIPTPVLLHGRFAEAFDSPGLYALATGLAAFVGWDVWRRRRSSASTPISLVGILLCAWCTRQPFTPFPLVPTDDWHFGEVLLPYTAWRDFGLVPFIDLMPVRGFISLVNAGLSDLLLTSDAGDVLRTSGVTGLLFAALMFAALLPLTGALWAAFAVVAFAADPVLPIAQPDMLFAICFCVTLIALQHTATRAHFLAIWLAVAIGFFLLAPGQGGLFTLATVPMAFAAAWLNRSLRSSYHLSAFVPIAVVTVVCALSPTCRQIAVGIMQYFDDQVSINTIGHGYAWRASWQSGMSKNFVWLELVRSAALVVAGGVLGAMLWTAVRYWQCKPHRPLPIVAEALIRFATAASIVLAITLTLPRALGRIDPGDGSRLGLLTMLVFVALLPTLYVRQLTIVRLTTAIWCTSLLASALNPSLQPFVVFPKLHHDISGSWVDAPALGLDGIGQAAIEAEHLERLLALREAIDQVLPPRQGYYDFTNRNAHYVYLNRPVPVQWSTPFYIANESAQVRMVEALERRAVPLILIKASNIEHGDGTQALRAHWLYRYALSHFVPFEQNGMVFAVRRDLSEHSPYASLVPPDPEERLRLWNEAFAPRDLHAVPASWGASLDSLAHRIESISVPVELEALADRATIIAWSQSSIDASPGAAPPMLKLLIRCRDGDSHPGFVRWSMNSTDTAPEAARWRVRTGWQLVPLDAYPRWLGAHPPTAVTFATKDEMCLAESAELVRRKPPPGADEYWRYMSP